MGADTSHLVGCVVAIDFGTFNSGYAFCMKNGDKIKFDPKWGEGRISTDLLMDSKMEKCIEFEPMAGKSYRKSLDKQCRKLGAVCDTRQKKPKMPNESSTINHPLQSIVQTYMEVPDYADPVLLEKIKLQVLALQNPVDFRLKAVSGEEVHATTAFAAALSFMRTRCLENISSSIDTREILWIVTVPAAWGNMQRHFMTLAANQSGVMASATTHNFTILTESESSVAFCRQLLPSQFKDPDLATGHLSHQNYMVDAGGTYSKPKQENTKRLQHSHLQI